MLKKLLASSPRDSKQLWQDGIKDEMAFWENWFKTKGSNWPDDYVMRLDPLKPLSTYLNNYLPEQRVVSILDVGSGPLTVLGKVLEGYEIHITAVDPLADLYNEVMKNNNVTPLVAPQYCDAENLTSKFEVNRFDIVHMCNALDHSYDPVKGITQMLSVAKKGGYVFLTHSTNEAEKANYGGFHQWNLCVEGDQFIIWNKEKRINVNNVLTDIAGVEVSFDGDWHGVAIRKNES